MFTDGMKSGVNWVTYDAPLAIYFYGSPYCDPADPIVAATYAMLAAEASTQRAPHGTPDAPFTTLALVLQFAFVLLLLAAVGGSTIAVALAVRRSRLSDRLLRFGLVPAAVVTLSMVVGLGATIFFTVLIFVEAPQLQGSPGNLEIVIVFMGGAAVAAIHALWHGWRTSREHAA